MGSLHDDIISGVVGAVSGGVAGALVAVVVAPTQAEREERGRRRVEGRSQIAAAVEKLSYELTEARGRKFRLKTTDNLLDQASFLEFVGAIKQGSMFLRWPERVRAKRRAKKLAGRLIWRLAEIVPSEHYADVDEASVLQATADTRTSTDKRTFGPSLTDCPPTDAKWDAALKIINKMRKTYPS
jgi:hypothetical protein